MATGGNYDLPLGNLVNGSNLPGSNLLKENNSGREWYTLSGIPAASTNQALALASQALTKSTASPYPSYTPSQAISPTQQSYYNYTPNSPMAQVQAPNYQMSAGNAPTYQGLMGGEYDKLQTALQTPGDLSAQNAYNTGYRNLTNTMGGRGLYGSSMMQTQANEGINRELMNSLASNASNAAAQRYNMQLQDTLAGNQFARDIYGQNISREQDQNKYTGQMAELMKNQNYDTWRAGLADSERQSAYNKDKLNWDYQLAENQRNWQNAQGAEQYQYQLAKNAYDNQIDEMMLNRALAVAGKGAPLAQAAQNYQLAQQQVQAQKDAAAKYSNSQLVGAGAGLLGDLLGSSTKSGGSLLSSIFGQ